MDITMKKLFTSLPFRLLAGVVTGILAGWLAGMESAGKAGTAVMNVVVSVRFILAELINFCVPLIIIGFIAPSITRLGYRASRMLGIALLCAYASTILAAFFFHGGRVRDHPAPVRSIGDRRGKRTSGDRISA